MGNRWFLLAGLLVSLTLPFLTVKKIVHTKSVLLSSTEQMETATKVLSEQFNNLTNWDVLFAIVYVAGVLLLMTRLVFQLTSLKSQIATKSVSYEEGFYHVKTKSQSSPFSFFKYIFYNPQNFSERELQSILAHEKEHAIGYHSLDILLMELVLAVLWFNPIAWLYRISIKQNLEFLADSKSHGHIEGMKFYQYLMLKQVTGQPSLSLANPFYNSLIKKRIVMLNKNRSKKTNALKMLIILPVLVFFLFSFNTKNVYVLQLQNNDQPGLVETLVDFIIDKDTSDEELEKIKKDLDKEDIDFSYTVVRNENGEIINVSLNLNGKNDNGKNFNGSYNSDSNEPIEPITVFYDDKSNFISFGTSPHKMKKLDHGNSTFWISSTKEGDSLHEIIVSEEETEKFIIDNDNSKNHKKVITKHKSKDKDHNSIQTIYVTTDSDEIEHIEINEDHNFTFVNTQEGKDPLYIVDGKIVSKKKFEKLTPDEIKSMNVLKGEKAIEEYGKKAENGVLIIITKKSN